MHVNLRAGGQETRITMRVSMELVALFAHWKSGTTDTLEVEARWRVPHRETGEPIEFRNASERKLTGVKLGLVGSWLRGETEDTPEIFYEVLHEACAGAMQHEVFEGLRLNGVQVYDPHEEK